MLASLAAALETRKLLFLSRRPGLIPNGGPVIPVVSLATDTQRLLAPGTLPRGQAMLLRQAKLLVESVPHRLSVTVVNPLQLLRELFTVNGAGTLIRRGSRIDVHTAWNGLDRARIEALFASAFERPVRSDFFAQPLARIFVEENYSGVAVVQDSPVVPYLTKFAVERQAQGEGIGGELWSLLARDFPQFFWRSRPANPIGNWYVKQCDGFARFPEWHVFWRGVAPESIEPAIRYALGLPADFS
jgi:acetylglutamate synthase